VTALNYKRDEIIASIRLYEKQPGQGRTDLAHINASIKIFEASGDPKEMTRSMDTHPMFGRGEPIALCKEVLAIGPKPARELASHEMESKGLNTGDKVFSEGCSLSAHPFFAAASLGAPDCAQQEERGCADLAAALNLGRPRSAAALLHLPDPQRALS
jgi:hypothetical protein